VPQRVRERRLAVLLDVARALDIPALPDDLVENLGIPYPVGLADLRQTGPELGAAAAFRPSPLQWLTPQVPLRHLCAASTKLGIPLPEVAVRLRRLGIDVPDVADTVRAAMARLPRPSREPNPA
jgi:hypothetical protein